MTQNDSGYNLVFIIIRYWFVKTFYALLFLLGSLPSLAQPEVYKEFEVDSAAQPRGGITYLNTYIQANLRKPLLAEAAGVGGRVIISGIVEPNGRISNVTVMQSPRPDLGREALRVFNQFDAWQPAKKGGKVVRQSVTLPVTFRANKPFTYTNGKRVNFFDSNRKPLVDSSESAAYRQTIALDTNGIPTGDLIVYQRKRSEWKEEYRLPLVIKQFTAPPAPGVVRKMIGHQNEDKMWQGTTYSLSDDGTVLVQAVYENGRETGSRLNYHPNGLIAERHESLDGQTTITSWYPNGQIKQIWIFGGPSASISVGPSKIIAVWDSLGQQSVKDGNGTATHESQIESRRDTTQRTTFVEKGTYTNGAKHGLWTGRYTDGSYFYEERYDQGTCQNGKAWSAATDTVRYTAAMEQPEFKGGNSQLGQFLAQNLRYPVDAQRARVQGRVFVSFVVKADGHLSDYKIIKGVNADIDQEALRVVKAMDGKWKPGTHRGETISVRYNLPINFTLQ